jgi:uncharacterized protein YneF (UPF0154 family)
MDEFSSSFAQADDVIFLEGLFFLKSKLIKKNPPLVKNAFKEMYRWISKN